MKADRYHYPTDHNHQQKKTIEMKMIDGDENANNHKTSFSPTDPIPQCKKEEEEAQTEADI